VVIAGRVGKQLYRLNRNIRWASKKTLATLPLTTSRSNSNMFNLATDFVHPALLEARNQGACSQRHQACFCCHARDPDPKNSSAGIKILKAADIEISVGLLEEDALTTVAGTWPNKVSRNGSRNLPFLIRV